MASTTSQNESKSCKRRKDLEVLDSEMLQYALQSDQPSSDADISQDGDFDAVLKDLKKEINLLFSRYAKTLSERSAVDALYVEEFDEILKEVKSVEVHLKEKRESLRNRLTMIANTLQSR